MSRIHHLDTAIINKIAAGEVIERPANVVKELLENSIDALSTRIDVEIEQGGSDLIRVVDNGEGIHPDDIEIAVSPHATSKIDSADDLFSVQTMGFRGEALASIAEVSHLRIRSRREEELAGIELEVHCGKRVAPQPCGCPVGTSVEIRQIFAGTPVRRKFLKTTPTEFGHISEQFTRIALANPRLQMTMRHNGKSVFELPPVEKLIDRLSLFYGKDLADNLIWTESEAAGNRIWGYVAHPSQSKSTRKGQYLFLNGRWIQDRSLQHALTEAYRGLLMTGRQPIVFLFFEIPADSIDVNVHPTKAEVRFRDGQQLYRQLLSMIRNRFLGMNLESEYRLSDSETATPTIKPDPARQQQLQVELSTWAKSQLSQLTPETMPRPSGEGAPISNDVLRLGQRPATQIPPSDPFTTTASGADITSSPDADVIPESNRTETAETDVESPARNADQLAQRVDSSETFDKSPHVSELRAMQIHDCYLVVETDDGVTLIDQHALHERILYEYLRKRVLEGAVESQRMLVPETVELSSEEVGLLMDNAETLATLGIGIEDFGGNTVLVNSYPAILSNTAPGKLVRDLAEQLTGTEKTPSRRDILDSLLHMMSCKAAIKAGQRLTREEIDSLLEQRHLIDDAHHCPHGRPTALVLSRSDLDRQFGRLG